MALVPLRQRDESPRVQAFGASETRKPAFGSALPPKFQLVLRLARDNSGVAAIEYALLASLIAIAIISGAENLGNVLGKTWDDVATAVRSAIDGSEIGGGGGNNGNGNGNGGVGGGNGNGNNGNGNGNGNGGVGGGNGNGNNGNGNGNGGPNDGGP